MRILFLFLHLISYSICYSQFSLGDSIKNYRVAFEFESHYLNNYKNCVSIDSIVISNNPKIELMVEYEMPDKFSEKLLKNILYKPMTGLLTDKFNFNKTFYIYFYWIIKEDNKPYIVMYYCQEQEKQ